MPRPVVSALSVLALLLCPPPLSAQNASLSPDFNGDQIVDIDDFFLFTGHFGTGPGDPGYDARYNLDGEGLVEIADFWILVENWGPVPVSAPEAALARFNEQRQQLGLRAFEPFVEGDHRFISVEEFLVGCEADLQEYAELTRPDLDGIGLSVSDAGSECGLRVVTYHIVPHDRRMRVERAIWECFTESRDLQEPNDISCAGRFTYFGRHVRWLPEQVFYTIAAGEDQRDRFVSHIPWIEETLKVRASEAGSPDAADLVLHLGVQSPPDCPERYGCSVWGLDEDGYFGAIYISAPDEFFSQVLKHELLHALLPMGHLPEGNYLMSVRPPDPSQTHTLTPREKKLLELYTNPYLREGMTMEKFNEYLIVE